MALFQLQYICWAIQTTKWGRRWRIRCSEISFSADIIANRETALGKADLVLNMPKTVYVIELKYDQSLESAKTQIRNRRYAKAYLDSGKRIVKLAIKFSSKDRNIESYEAVEEKI